MREKYDRNRNGGDTIQNKTNGKPSHQIVVGVLDFSDNGGVLFNDV